MKDLEFIFIVFALMGIVVGVSIGAYLQKTYRSEIYGNCENSILVQNPEIKNYFTK